MVRVCHITDVHRPEDGRIFHKECCSLAEAGYEVYLVAQGESYNKNGVHIVGIGEKPQKKAKRMLSFAKKAYRRALELDCDIYHIHDPELLPYAAKLKAKGKIVVFDSHEIYKDLILSKDYLQKPVRKIVSSAFGIVQKSVLDKIDAVIVPCLISGDFPIECKTKYKCVIDNVPKLDLYRDYREDTEKIPRSVCYFGTLYSATWNLIEAVKEIDAELFVAGRAISDEDEAKMMSMVDEKIHYLGFVKQEDVARYLNKMEIGFAALLNEGQFNKFDNLPTKTYEYMAMSMPVVISECDYNTKLNNKYNFGVCVDAGNVQEIEKALCYLLNNSKEALIKGQNGRNMVLEYYNWNVENDKLLGLYSSLANEINAIK